MTNRTMFTMLGASALLTASFASGALVARDPGVRGGAAGAGTMIAGLSAAQQEYFTLGADVFAEVDGISDGLGPRFNLDSCAGCHAQPAMGGSSPLPNPQVAVATAFGANNVVPSFIRPDGPVREVRFKRNPDGTPDGGVHALFVISGRRDDTGNASSCKIEQEDFETQVAQNNAIFRIPTPVFGGGLIEQIADAAILANWTAGASDKAALGITGRPHFILPTRPASTGSPNRNGNDGTIARFGWKAQNKSLLIFAGEAYNVEQGVTNELFQTERDETPNCQYRPTPNDVTNMDGASGADVLSDVQKFAIFMRFLGPPAPSPDTPGGTPSIARGKGLFSSVGCAFCHTPTLSTGYSTVQALNKQPANLYSDLLLHHMGTGLADFIRQGQAGDDEFRTAPLWGVGQRIFFLHDGRTADLLEAINAHKSPGDGNIPPSEANAVVDRFQKLTESQKQDLLNFLRSL